jgi:hypothetical protein
MVSNNSEGDSSVRDRLTMMLFRTRPLDPNADLPRLAELTTAARRESVTADILAERERQSAVGGGAY